MPEMTLKVVSCVKKSDKEVREVTSNLFGDLSKCYDETKGSVLFSIECVLKNSLNHLLNVISVSQKVAACAFKNKNAGRLCVSVTNAQDETCPFAIGI